MRGTGESGSGLLSQCRWFIGSTDDVFLRKLKPKKSRPVQAHAYTDLLSVQGGVERLTRMYHIADKQTW